MQRKLLLTSLMVSLLCCSCCIGRTSYGQESAEPPGNPPATRSSRVRLPAYFASVVTRSQREEVYKIQLAWLQQIEKLEQQIAEMELKRDQEVDAVLDPQQLAEVNKRREAAEQRRRARQQPVTAEPAESPPAE